MDLASYSTPSYVEDLDIGFRAWQRGWPTIFVARSHVTHYHRTTTRYFTPEQLEHIVERNYLRFLKRSVSNPEIFTRLWRHAIDRLNWKSAVEHHRASLEALLEAKDHVNRARSTWWMKNGSSQSAAGTWRSFQAEPRGQRQHRFLLLRDALHSVSALAWRRRPDVQPDAPCRTGVCAGAPSRSWTNSTLRLPNCSKYASKSCRCAGSEAISSPIAVARMWWTSSIRWHVGPL